MFGGFQPICWRNMLQLPGRNHAHVADAEAHERRGCGSDDSSRGRREKYVSALWATRRRIGNTLPVDANSWDMLACSEYDSVHSLNWAAQSIHHDLYQFTVSIHIRFSDLAWGSPAAGRGGLHWCTFKATCRREGEWREDFNELLADPLNRRIAVEWDRVLNQLLPDHVDTLLSRIVQETWFRRGSILLSQKQNAVLARVWTPNNDKHQVKCL